MDSGRHKIRLHCDGGEFNVNSFEFVKTGNIQDINSNFISARTLDMYNVEILMSKPIDFSSIPASLLNNPNSDFTLHIDSTTFFSFSNFSGSIGFPSIFLEITPAFSLIAISISAATLGF